MSVAYKNALKMQSKAAMPAQSIFVSANAGSGKTRVLVERVSRILLTGTLPDKILCLTYTKAAASEMQTRLFAALGDWSIMSEEELTTKLNTLENKTGKRAKKDINRARSLFARALETPGGLKVQTIHAFCERVLKRFPLEAGIAPGSEAIDEREAAAIQEQVSIDIETEATANPNEKLAQDIALLATHKNDQDIDSIYRWAMGNSYKIDAWLEAGGTDTLAKLLNIDAAQSPEKIMRDAWETAPIEQLRIAARHMMDGGVNDQKRAKNIISALEAQSPENAFVHYVKMFFTQNNEPLKNIVTAKAGEVAISLFGNSKTGHQHEALRMIEANTQLKAVQFFQLNAAAYNLAILAAARYREIKRQRRVIDFGDMIYLARDLLSNNKAREWVRYKLDNGVDHILVDEAQDTSSAQWDIVDALSDEFFQTGANTKVRTVFAVGDEKQSIYGFQGAEPELFLKKIQNLTKEQPNTKDVKMSMSFRSTRQILDLVDQIYYKDKGILETFDADTFPLVSDEGYHDANREDNGIVEFWPASQKPETGTGEIAWNPTPVDKLDARSSREKLAAEISKQLKHWLDTDEPVFDRKLGHTRPMRASDVLILVQKRTKFFDAVIRNLKSAGVPVAGADRLKLTESIAVQDMLSLAKFTLLPADDLSLAEVLKSPLFGWDDDQLFEIAYNRKSSLWAALPNGSERTTLTHILSLANKFAPYEFFARTLALVPGDSGSSLLQNIYGRLGLEAADALDVFLSRALSHQRRGAPSLQRFINDIEKSESTIKREMDVGQNEVRVMSVHGSKGLESPVVILPDTTQAASRSRDTFFKFGDSFVMRTAKNETPEALQELDTAKQKEADREAMRLLYVALTRAESRLLICGFESNGKVHENSWHRRIQNALEGMSDITPIQTPFGDGLQFGHRASSTDKQEHISKTKTVLPPWIYAKAKPSPFSAQFLSPSQLIKPEDADKFDQQIRSPLSKSDDMLRFARGNYIHKLLEILPQIPSDKRTGTAQSYLQKQGLDKTAAAILLQEVFAVLEHPEFAHIFAPGSQAEVSLAGGAPGLPDNVRLSGQIDRLSITNDTVWIVDYKSNRPPPKTVAGVAQLYIRQMAAYRALVRELYPDKKVRTVLLWTDGPTIMEIPNTVLDNVKWDDILQA